MTLLRLSQFLPSTTGVISIPQEHFCQNCTTEKYVESSKLFLKLVLRLGSNFDHKRHCFLFIEIYVGSLAMSVIATAAYIEL